MQGYIRTNWSEDPFSFGSYSYVAKGTSRADYAALEAPVDGTVFFAGEATHPDFNSTVHAAYISGQRAAQSVLETRARRVAIIGAGMSGLSAAQTLSGEGRDVTVIEARDRIGGRVWSSNQLGFNADLGAAWIHGIEGNPLTELSDRLDITRQLTKDDYAVRGGDGRKLGLLDTPGWLFDEGEIQVAYGADKDLIDPSGITATDGFDGPDVSFPGGYSQIFEAFKGDYAVELPQAVAGVQYGGEGVSVSLADGTARGFDAVVVTVPLGVLKAGVIAFDPPLPQAKQSAITRMGMGLLDKVYLKFDRVFWDADATWIGTPDTDLPRGYFNQWFNLAHYIDEPVIVGLNGGSAALALAKESDESVIEMALQTLRRAYPA